MRLRERELLIIVLFLLLFPLRGSTQTGPRRVHGTVVDLRGNLLPKSVVELENESTQQIQSFIIQEDGAFYFKGLSPNVDLLLHAQYRSKLSKTIRLSRFDSDKDLPIRLVIPVE